MIDNQHIQKLDKCEGGYKPKDPSSNSSINFHNALIWFNRCSNEFLQEIFCHILFCGICNFALNYKSALDILQFKFLYSCCIGVKVLQKELIIDICYLITLGPSIVMNSHNIK